MNSDDAVSEVLGFVLVFGLVIILVSLVTAAALPNLIKESEIEDNEKAAAVTSETRIITRPNTRTNPRTSETASSEFIQRPPPGLHSLEA